MTEDNAVYHFGLEQLQRTLLNIQRIIRIAKNNRILVMAGGILDSTGNFRKVGIGDVRQNKSQGIRFPKLKTPGNRVGYVAAFIDDVPNTATGCFADVHIRTIKNLRNSGNRNACLFRHIFDCYQLLSPKSSGVFSKYSIHF